ncbi:MAG TPA: NAD(P)H-hydrate dehydratase, partial [Stenomitos sp.]
MPIVSAQQMQRIEETLFASGMPVPALMEKVGGLLAQRVQALYPLARYAQVGILVGPGHNGGDALVVARELWLRGYRVSIYMPFARAKELTQAHAQFARSLSIPFVDTVDQLRTSDLLIDGLFGFGLERELSGDIAAVVTEVNQWGLPVVSIDLPSGIHTDTGAVLGSAIRATHTLCLGLWKLGIVQEQALEWVGQAALIDFDIPATAIALQLGQSFPIQRLMASEMVGLLPLVRPRSTHKYRQGHLLLVGGSQRYAGGIILSALGARAAGVGMLSIVVPASLKALMVARLPDAIVYECSETSQGAIASLPDSLALDRFDVVAYGPGVTTESSTVLEPLLGSNRPLVLDADGLTLLAQLGVEQLSQRSATTVLTPHAGEFQRLFPELGDLLPYAAAQQAAQAYNSIVVYKGACTAIAAPNGQVWLNTESTPALARGGSGDV